MKSRTIVLWLLLGLLLSLTAGCRERISRHNFDRVEVGMTVNQVESILGRPTTARGFDVGVFAGRVASWRGNGLIITVQFANNRVRAKQLIEDRR